MAYDRVDLQNRGVQNRIFDSYDVTSQNGHTTCTCILDTIILINTWTTTGWTQAEMLKSITYTQNRRGKGGSNDPKIHKTCEYQFMVLMSKKTRNMECWCKKIKCCRIDTVVTPCFYEMCLWPQLLFGSKTKHISSWKHVWFLISMKPTFCNYHTIVPFFCPAPFVIFKW